MSHKARRWLGLGIVLAGLEALAWTVAPSFALRDLVELSDDPLVFMLRPGARVSFHGFYETLPAPVLWQVNAQGMRASRSIELVPKRFRIATFGDSEAFGWAVELEQTFQHQMEAIDGAIEVLNFAIPGYNAANIAHGVDRSLEDYSPQLCFYLVNPNDADPPPHVTRAMRLVARSALLRIVQYLYYRFVEGPREIRRRQEPETRRRFAAEVARFAERCQRRSIPVILGLLAWNDRSEMPPGVKTLNVEAVLAGLPLIDHHMTEAGHRALAHALCETIAEGAPGRCTPPGGE